MAYVCFFHNLCEQGKVSTFSVIYGATKESMPTQLARSRLENSLTKQEIALMAGARRGIRIR